MMVNSCEIKKQINKQKDHEDTKWWQILARSKKKKERKKEKIITTGITNKKTRTSHAHHIFTLAHKLTHFLLTPSRFGGGGGVSHQCKGLLTLALMRVVVSAKSFVFELFLLLPTAPHSCYMMLDAVNMVHDQYLSVGLLVEAKRLQTNRMLFARALMRVVVSAKSFVFELFFLLPTAPHSCCMMLDAVNMSMTNI